jgi:hypothetical protein
MSRKPIKPFERENRKLKPSGHQKPKGVRPWREEHAEAKAQAIASAAKIPSLRTAITDWVSKLRRSHNDDTVLREVAETMVNRDDVAKCASSMTILHSPVVDIGLKAAPGHRYQLIHALRLLLPTIKVVEPERDETPTYRGHLRNQKD